jgi:DNA-binding transcriptional MocR family regulator
MLEIFKEIQLDRESERPLYQQLFELLRSMVESGRLLRDTKLPSIRGLARALEINQVTVVTAYRLLEDNGFVYSRTGSGTYVAGLVQHLPARPDNPLLQDELYPQAENPSWVHDQILVSENTINFASASPTSDLFPVDNFKVVLNEVLDRDKGNAFRYHESQGYLPLRESIAGLLGKGRMDFPVEDINVISGAQQGIDIIAKALIRPGDCILTESPTYTGAVAVFKSRSGQMADVAMQPGGPDLNQLEYLLKKYRPKFMYTIPSFQNPTGCSYTNEKRRALLGLADKYNFFILEDDYVSDLDFDHSDYLPLKSMDARGRVILIKSFSKLFMPGLRLGFMIVPPQLSQDLLAAKHTADISTSGLVQRAFDLYIRKGYWNGHFDFMYGIYRDRYYKITSALDRHLPEGCSYIKPGGGLNIWISLPAGFPTGSLMHLAAAGDIAFAPGTIFHTGNTPDAANNLRLSFAAVQTDKIEAGVGELCSLIRRLSANPYPGSAVPVF